VNLPDPFIETAQYPNHIMSVAKMTGNIRLILTLTLIGLIVLFSIQNVAEVEVQFLFWSFTTRRAFLIFAVLAIGVIVGWVIHSVHYRAQRRDFEKQSDDRKRQEQAASAAQSDQQ